MGFTDAELATDIVFLAERGKRAGGINFTSERDTGSSSNAIVSLAYLNEPVKVLPMDGSDLEACENMWLKLPSHRKATDVVAAMERARKAI